MTSKLVLPFDIFPRWNFLDVVVNLQRWDDTSPGLLEKVIMVYWGIWENRNVLRLGGKGKADRTLLRSALHLVDEYHAENEVKAGNRTESAPMVTW